MKTTQQKLDEIITFLSAYDFENEGMKESWQDFRAYYCQAYIWGWQDPDYKQYLREMARIVVGQPDDLIRKIQDRNVLPEKYYEKAVLEIHKEVHENHWFRSWRLELVQQ